MLTEASLRGAMDSLIGLKENVLLGHLIPAGSGFRPYQEIRVKPLVALPEDEEAADDAMLEDFKEAAPLAAATADPLPSNHAATKLL